MPPDPRVQKLAFIAACRPHAEVYIDGVQAGSTPLRLTLAPGKHQVTFATGDKKTTRTVDIKAGQTETLSMDLR